MAGGGGVGGSAGPKTNVLGSFAGAGAWGSKQPVNQGAIDVS